MMEKIKKFYRVHVKLLDDEPCLELAFDFKNSADALNCANFLFNGCDIVKVWIEIIENEIDTTNSPMWRTYEKH